jgi:hypothetical protein
MDSAHHRRRPPHHATGDAPQLHHTRPQKQALEPLDRPAPSLRLRGQGAVRVHRHRVADQLQHRQVTGEAVAVGVRDGEVDVPLLGQLANRLGLERPVAEAQDPARVPAVHNLAACRRDIGDAKQFSQDGDELLG